MSHEEFSPAVAGLFGRYSSVDVAPLVPGELVTMSSQKENIPGPGDGSDVVKCGYLKKLKVRHIPCVSGSVDLRRAPP